MNEYLLKTGKEFLNEIFSEAAGFVGDVAGSKLSQYVCVISGLTQERLDALASGAAPDETEFLALCDAILYLAKQPGNEGFTEAAETAERLKVRWMDERFQRTKNAANIVDALVEVSDKESEAEFLCSYHLFLDASSLCSREMPVFLDKLLPAMEAYGNPHQITVPQAVINCLNALASTPEQAELSKANEGLAQLKRIQDAKLLSIRGDEGDSTLMSTFLSAFSRFKPVYRMVLITQDEALAKAVSLLNSSGVEGNDILIASLQEDGVLVTWFKTADRMAEDKSIDENSEDDSDAEYNMEILFEEGSVEEVETENLFEEGSDEEVGAENLFEEDLDDEYDDALEDDTIISEDDLEKIMSINELLPVEDEADETGPVEIEEPDELELLEEERLTSSFLLEPDFEELDEGVIEEFEKEDSGEKEDGMEDTIQPGSWSTLE